MSTLCRDPLAAATARGPTPSAHQRSTDGVADFNLFYRALQVSFTASDANIELDSRKRHIAAVHRLGNPGCEIGGMAGRSAAGMRCQALLAAACVLLSIQIVSAGEEPQPCPRSAKPHPTLL